MSKHALRLYTLEFEKPIVELEQTLDALRKQAHDQKIDLTLQIHAIEHKLEVTKKEIFTNLTPWQRVQLARHPKRPYTLDYLQRIAADFIELHGDRRFADDRSIVGGFATIDGHRVMVIGQQKGRDTKENLLRNFGSPHPEGYRKALRLMQLAEKFDLPVISFIDTPGAYPGVGAEERHIAEAIAVNLREMMVLKTPLIAIVLGEGGSGGAHKDYDATAATLKQAVLKELSALLELRPADLLAARYQKFRRMGVFERLEPKKRVPTVKSQAVAVAAGS